MDEFKFQQEWQHFDEHMLILVGPGLSGKMGRLKEEKPRPKGGPQKFESDFAKTSGKG